MPFMGIYYLCVFWFFRMRLPLIFVDGGLCIALAGRAECLPFSLPEKDAVKGIEPFFTFGVSRIDH